MGQQVFTHIENTGNNQYSVKDIGKAAKEANNSTKAKGCNSQNTTGLSETSGSKGGGQSIEINAESLKYSNSASHSGRPYQQSTQTIQEIINSGSPKADPRGSAGLWWNIDGSFNGTSGHYELLISPDKTTIWHYLFKGY